MPIFGPKKKNLTWNGAIKLKELWPNSPLGALAAEMEAQYVQVSTCNIPASWPNQWQLGPNQVPQGWPWPSWAPKRDFMGQRGPFCGLQECCRGPLRGRAHDLDAAHPVGPTSGTWAQIRPPGAAREPPGPPKGLYGPKWALLGAPG